MFKFLLFLQFTISLTFASGGNAGKMGNLESGEGNKKFDIMNTLFNRKGGPQNIVFTSAAVGFNINQIEHASLGFKDSENTFQISKKPYADIRIYSQLPRDWFLNVAVEHSTADDDLRRVKFDLSGRRIGSMIELGRYRGQYTANIFEDQGANSIIVKRTRDFDAPFLRATLYFKQLSADEGGERKTFYGLGFIRETKPTTLRYRNSLLTPENLTFFDPELEYQWLGLMALRNPLRWIRLEGPTQGKQSGGYLSSETLIGGMKAKASSEIRYHLYRYAGNQGVKQESWGGLGIWGKYELGYYWKMGTAENPILINASYQLEMQLPFFLRYLKFENLQDFNDAEIEFPKNSPWVHGISVQASLSF